MNRTPLHIAAGTRANLSTIQLLADAYPAACATLDEGGKTPLHLACDSACELFEGDEGCDRDPPSYDVVLTIINAWLSAVPWEDKDGTSALEFAILSDAPIKVVRLLQAATCKVNREAAGARFTVMEGGTQYSLGYQQPTHPMSEPSQQESMSPFDATASTSTSMPARNGHEASFGDAARWMWS